MTLRSFENVPTNECPPELLGQLEQMLASTLADLGLEFGDVRIEGHQAIADVNGIEIRAESEAVHVLDFAGAPIEKHLAAIQLIHDGQRIRPQELVSRLFPQGLAEPSEPGTTDH